MKVFFKQRRDMIRVVGTWENIAAAETGVKEIGQRIIVIMARNNQNLN